MNYVNIRVELRSNLELEDHLLTANVQAYLLMSKLAMELLENHFNFAV
jgi:hypothetical protein